MFFEILVKVYWWSFVFILVNYVIIIFGEGLRAIRREDEKSE